MIHDPHVVKLGCRLRPRKVHMNLAPLRRQSGAPVEDAPYRRYVRDRAVQHTEIQRGSHAVAELLPERTTRADGQKTPRPGRRNEGRLLERALTHAVAGTAAALVVRPREIRMNLAPLRRQIGRGP